MTFAPFEELEVYQLSEGLADETGCIAMEGAASFARDTPGRQIVRAADSTVAKIAEGTGRGSVRDNTRFVRIAGGPWNETRHWLRRAFRRKLLSERQAAALKKTIVELAPRLDACLNSLGKHG